MVMGWDGLITFARDGMGTLALGAREFSGKISGFGMELGFERGREEREPDREPALW
jgi:hypothetical protein